MIKFTDVYIMHTQTTVHPLGCTVVWVCIMYAAVVWVCIMYTSVNMHTVYGLSYCITSYPHYLPVARAIAWLPVKQPWKTWLCRFHDSTMNQYDKTARLFHATCCKRAPLLSSGKYSSSCFGLAYERSSNNTAGSWIVHTDDNSKRHLLNWIAREE